MRRATRVIKWGCLALAVLMLSADAASSWVGVAWSSGRPIRPVIRNGRPTFPSYWVFTIRSGRVGGGTVEHSVQIADLSAARGWQVFRPSADRMWGVTTLGLPGSRRRYFPLWMFTGVFGAAAAILLWRDTRPRPGYCTRCRYDLRGVTGGVCPECGTAVVGAHAAKAAARDDGA